MKKESPTTSSSNVFDTINAIKEPSFFDEKLTEALCISKESKLQSEPIKALSEHEQVALILDECKELLLKKGKDYNSGRVKMGDYYPRGILSVIDIMNAKMLRMFSLLESDQKANFESLEDSAKDLANYSAIFIAVSRGLISTPAK